MRYFFKKGERLHSKKAIDLLFKNGNSFSHFPFRVIFLAKERDPHFPVQMGIGVPKKKVGKAANRNKIKRIIREAYRKNKHLLYEELLKADKGMDLMLIFMDKEVVSYNKLELKLVEILNKLGREFQKVSH